MRDPRTRVVRLLDPSRACPTAGGLGQRPSPPLIFWLRSLRPSLLWHSSRLLVISPVCPSSPKFPDMASEEPATKKAKTGEESYYKVIDGVRYDRALLEAAEGFAADGQVGYPEARKLWKNAQDGAGVTDIEKATLEYAMKVYKFSEPARKFMTTYLAAGKHRSYYKTVSNVQYDRALLEAAEKAAADGQISWREAKQLLEDASDGKGMTGTEKATLEYALKTFKFTDKARKFLEGGLRVEKPASYPAACGRPVAPPCQRSIAAGVGFSCRPAPDQCPVRTGACLNTPSSPRPRHRFPKILPGFSCRYRSMHMCVRMAQVRKLLNFRDGPLRY
ncbi:unnamed protein product [Prorocentrum cordatum]|uniref:Uncharacterized protein n=2 Tax=Prorocentrum cordatum TaxID=2364126 RepID=A0ABN9VY37_9DINO|nr:unnamed protein product [Polarella glacialis]